MGTEIGNTDVPGKSRAVLDKLTDRTPEFKCRKTHCTGADAACIQNSSFDDVKLPPEANLVAYLTSEIYMSSKKVGEDRQTC